MRDRHLQHLYAEIPNLATDAAQRVGTLLSDECDLALNGARHGHQFPYGRLRALRDANALIAKLIHSPVNMTNDALEVQRVVDQRHDANLVMALGS